MHIYFLARGGFPAGGYKAILTKNTAFHPILAVGNRECIQLIHAEGLPWLFVWNKGCTVVKWSVENVPALSFEVIEYRKKSNVLTKAPLSASFDLCCHGKAGGGVDIRPFSPFSH